MTPEVKSRLLRAAESRGVEVKFRGPNQNHVQIVGGRLLVNWYPDAKKRSAYIAGTTQRRNNITPEQAVDMAFLAPTAGPGIRKDGRRYSNNNRKALKKRLRARDGDNCHWCKKPMVFGKGNDDAQSATIEHVIPLDRGGLDNPNNMVLAHKKCNNERGNNMPELEV